MTNPDERSESSPDLARDPLLRALGELPREDLDAWRSERLRQRAHAELARAAAQHREPGLLRLVTRVVEPLLLASCAIMTLVRFVGMVMFLVSAAH